MSDLIWDILYATGLAAPSGNVVMLNGGLLIGIIIVLAVIVVAAVEKARQWIKRSR